MSRAGPAVAAALTRLGLDPARPVVVGASGGLDSTVLAHLLHEAGVGLVLVHVDYGFRDGSAADARSVEHLAASLDAPAVIQRAGPLAAGNVQEEARKVRYEVFERVAARHGASAVAVGHTADDQAETVLMALLRGAGLRGLGGMEEARPLRAGSSLSLFRPLLQVEKRELRALADTRGWTWREDASNATDAFRRNRLRHHVLPLLDAEAGGRAARHIAEAARRLRELDAADGPKARLRRVGVPTPEGGRLPLDALRVLGAGERSALIAEALAAWMPDAPRPRPVVRAVAELVGLQPGRRIEVGAGVVWRDRDALTVRRRRRAPWEGVPVAVGETITPRGRLELTPDATPRRVAVAETLDADAVEGELRVRRWRSGDRIRPVGQDRPRSVADLLDGVRVAPSERGGVLVVEDAAGLVWLVGHALAHRVRLRPKTARALRLRWRAEEPPSGGRGE